jgi:hypothetical protein
VIADSNALLGVATDAIGEVELVADHSWPHGESVVIEVARRSGEHLYVKAYRQHSKFEREIHAYRNWTAALGAHAPTLVAVDEAVPAAVMTAVPGDPVSSLALDTGAEQHLYRRAGRLLRQLHDVRPAVSDPDYLARAEQRLEAWLGRDTCRLVDDDEAGFARALLGELRGEVPAVVPCHRDYDDRNWLFDGCDLAIVDFEHARLDPGVEDLIRLSARVWPDRPDLERSFFDGYGRRILDVERGWLRALSALSFIATIVWAYEHDDPAYGAFARRALRRAMHGR